MGLTKNLKKLFGMEPAGKEETQEPTLRWDKAITAVNGVATEVAKIDPDGIDLYCFGQTGINKHLNLTDPASLANFVSLQNPSGPCRMGSCLEMVFADAKKKGGDKPCHILVLTAGLPEDEQAVMAACKQATQEQREHLSITFVQVGDDQQAEAFLKHIDEDLRVQSPSGKYHDIIDTVKDEELQNAMEELQSPAFLSKGMVIGGLVGAIAGAAVGVTGAHLVDHHFARLRTQGWNGQWEIITQPGDAPSGVVLKVVDSMDGKFSIEGYPQGTGLGLPSVEGDYQEMTVAGPASSGPAEYRLRRKVAVLESSDAKKCRNGCGRQSFKTYPTCCTHCKGPTGPHARDCRVAPRMPGRYVTGTVVDEHCIQWSDNTTWREVPPPGTSWAKLGGGAAAGGGVGLVAGGAMGHLIQKKFFNKAANRDPADYIIVLDCSEAMSLEDTGKGFKAKK